MKKVFLLVTVIVISTIGAFAQFNLGIKAGLNYNTIKAQNKSLNESGVLGYQAGVWARIGKSFYLQPEIYLGSKGSQFTYQTNDTSPTIATAEKNFTTIDVPLLLGKKFGVEKLNFRIMAGPSFQFNLDDNSGAFAQAANPDFYRYKEVVTNGQLGAGVDLGNLSVDLRYETSLQDINKNGGQRQNLMHLSLGFKIL